MNKRALFTTSLIVSTILLLIVAVEVNKPETKPNPCQYIATPYMQILEKCPGQPERFIP